MKLSSAALWASVLDLEQIGHLGRGIGYLLIVYGHQSPLIFKGSWQLTTGIAYFRENRVYARRQRRHTAAPDVARSWFGPHRLLRSILA